MAIKKLSTKVLLSMATVAVALSTLTTIYISSDKNAGESGNISSATKSMNAEFLAAAQACLSATDRYGCIYSTADKINLSSIDSVNLFFQAVENDNLGPGCYGAAEKIGRATWKIHGRESFRVGTPACETGYLHGLFAEAGQSGEDVSFLAQACELASIEQNRDELWTPSMMFTCLVGVGRGYASQVESLDEGVEICKQELKNNKTQENGKFKAIEFCIRGLVLELFTAEKTVPEAVRDCLELGGTLTDACLALGLRAPAGGRQGGIDQLAVECANIIEAHAQYCMFVLSDVLAQRLFFEGSTVEPNTLKICSESNSCASHYAKFIITATWDPMKTIESCKLLLGNGINDCANAVPTLTRDSIKQGHLPKGSDAGLPPVGQPVVITDKKVKR